MPLGVLLAEELQQEVGPSVDTGQADIEAETYAKAADGSAEDDGDSAVDQLLAPLADTEAEGLRLHMSAKSNSGYLGVNRKKGTFR